MTANRSDRPAPEEGVGVRVGMTRPWAAVGTTQAAGHAFRNGQLLGPEQLALAVDGAAPECLPMLLKDLTGSFAAIKLASDAAYAVVDQIRGIPLYVVEGRPKRVVTDDPLGVCPEVRANGCDWPRRAELLKSASVSGSDTLLERVHQVEAGSLLRVPARVTENVESLQWYAFRPNLETDASSDLVERAYETHRAAVDRAIRFAGDALVAVPLSGGLDSGILGALLSRADIDRDQVLTYTFGRPGNRESEVSRRVAEILGLAWEFVPYSEGTWHDLAAEPSWPGYVAWASSLAGVPGFSDIPAIIELRRRGRVPDGSVIIPGHTLGFVSGSFIPGTLLRRGRGSRSHAIDAVLGAYYKYRSNRVLAELLDRPASEIAEVLRERVDRALPESTGSISRRELVSLTETFGWKERQAKLIANSVRTYEHHELRWALPWWDREVLDFWASVPLHLRVGQRLRQDLGTAVGWPRKSRSRLDAVEERLDKLVRIIALDGPARRMRNLARRTTKRNRYIDDPLAAFALMGEDRFMRSFHGTETPRAMLAEDVLSSLGL